VKSELTAAQRTTAITSKVGGATSIAEQPSSHFVQRRIKLTFLAGAAFLADCLDGVLAMVEIKSVIWDVIKRKVDFMSSSSSLVLVDVVVVWEKDETGCNPCAHLNERTSGQTILKGCLL
jgi:hypothetical protein